jgi:anti-sigma factor RsiW
LTCAEFFREFISYINRRHAGDNKPDYRSCARCGDALRARHIQNGWRLGMKCTPSEYLLELYLDGELAARESAQMREHLDSCYACARQYRRVEQIGNDIRMHVGHYALPAGLEQRVQAALRKAAREERQPTRPLQNWMAVAAAVLLFVSIAWNVALLRSHASARDLLAQEVLSSHLRSLIGTHLVDIPSSDQHTVKPWFNGKLNFSPDVRDFARQGFPLVGGRIEYLDDRPVAALIYQRRKHLINLFLWPGPSSSSSGYSEMTKRGYNLLSWTQDGMTCWLVSDVPTSELEQFAQLYR